MNDVYAFLETAILGGFGFIDAETTDIFRVIWYTAALSIFIRYMINPREANQVMPLMWLVGALVFGYIIDRWEDLTQALAAGAWELGTMSVGAGVSDFRDFDGIIMTGLDMAAPLIASIKDAGWSFSISVWFLVIWNFIAAALLIGARVYLAFILFILMLTFLVVSMVAMISMAFSVWSKTAFVAEGAFRFLVGHCLSILGLGIVFSAITNIGLQIVFTVDTPFVDTLINVMASIVGVILALKTQEMIQGYFSGNPNMHSGIGGALRTMMLGAGAVRTLTALRNVGTGGGMGSGASNRNRSIPPSNQNRGGGATASTSRGVYGGTFRPSNARVSR